MIKKKLSITSLAYTYMDLKDYRQAVKYLFDAVDFEKDSKEVRIHESSKIESFENNINE